MIKVLAFFKVLCIGMRCKALSLLIAFDKVSFELLLACLRHFLEIRLCYPFCLMVRETFVFDQELFHIVIIALVFFSVIRKWTYSICNYLFNN